jgi:hypothetical protein
VRAPLMAFNSELKMAEQGWASLSGPAKEALAKFNGREDLGILLQRLVTSEKDAGNADRLKRLLSSYKKMKTGLASTDAEAKALAGEAGFAAGNYDWLNSPASIDQFLKDARTELRARAKSASMSFPGIWGEKK